MSTRAILTGVHTIAIVGLSPDPHRPSNEVATFLAGRGYDLVGVNPNVAGRTIHGAPVFASLGAIDRPVDMVDVFRASAAVGGIVEEALALAPRPRIIWMQLGVVDHAAKAKAEAAGLIVIMNNCPKIVLGG